MKIPTIAALRAFEAVERLGSVRSAARELSVTPSAVSHQISLLESQLDMTLFLRRGRSLILTSEGRTYLVSVRPALLSLSEATRKLKENAEAGSLVLRTYPNFVRRWLIPRLHTFKRAHPDIPIHIVSSMSPLDFSEPHIDAAIVFHTDPIHGYINHATIGGEILPVCSKEYLDNAPSLKRPVDLLRHELIECSMVSGEWRAWVQSFGVKVDKKLSDRYSFDSRDLVVEAPRHGVGVALALTPFVNSDLATNTLIEPLGLRRPHQGAHSLIAREDASLPSRFIAFREWLQGEFQKDSSPE